MKDLSQKSATELIQLVHSGSLAVSAIAESVLMRIDRMKPLNSVVNNASDVVWQQAEKLDAMLASGQRLPLHGLPVLVKDNIDTRDFPTTAGTPALANNQPVKNAGAVQDLIDAGAMIVGKTNLDELAAGVTGYNGFLGATHNPYNSKLISGGSSGGSAVAVSAGITPVALGTDTGGSCRIPASLCGVCGFRPSIGRYRAEGVVGMPLSRATVGLLAQDLDAIRLLDKHLRTTQSASHASPKTLRLAMPAPFYYDVDNDSIDVINILLDKLRDAGMDIIELDFPEVMELNEKISFPVAFAETKISLVNYLSQQAGLSLQALIEQMGTADVKQRMLFLLVEDEKAHARYRKAVEIYRPRLQQCYDDFFSQNKLDGIIYPTTRLPARIANHENYVELNGEQQPLFHSYVRNCDPGSNAGIPSLSIPAGITGNGLPVGLSIDARRGDDSQLLQDSMRIAELAGTIAAPDLREFKIN